MRHAIPILAGFMVSGCFEAHEIGQVPAKIGVVLPDAGQGRPDAGRVSEESCSGQPAGHVCRATSGSCDLAEMCDGISDACPPDVVAPAGTSCGGTDVCDGAGTCGQSACPVPVWDGWERVDLSPHWVSTIWGSGANDIWAANLSILHYDGVRWEAVLADLTFNVNGLWGSGPSDVWAVGGQGVILHWSGQSWQAVDSGTTERLNKVWGTGPGDIWVVGNSSLVLHWDGLSWQRVPSPAVDLFSDLWGSGPNDIWATTAVGTTSSVLHWDGTAWQTANTPAIEYALGVWGTAPDDVWVVGEKLLHWNGISWSSTPVQEGVVFAVDAWGNASDDVWATAKVRDLLHFDGSTWTRGSATTNCEMLTMGGIWAGEGEVWALGWPNSGPRTFALHRKKQ